jgi:acetoin reductase-like protein
VAIVTGAGRGIGRAIGHALSKEGASVVICDADGASAERTAVEVRNNGGKAIATKTNVVSNSDLGQMISSTVKAFGRVDILVNCAGVHGIARFEDITEQEWDRIMDVNVKGVFLCSQNVVRQMLTQGRGGKIVNIASISGKAAWPRIAHYTTSKHAVIGLTRSMAIDLAPYRINVNAVCPGDVVTDMQKEILKEAAEFSGKTVEEVRQEFIKKIPLGRLEQPEDVAKLVVFLCSEDADYMTGQAINLDGGEMVQCVC